VRSYVVRAGRITEGQRQAFTDHWGRYGLSLYDGRVDWSAIFHRSAPVVLEIGFGMGDSLAEMVEAEADKDFVGIEVHPPGVGRLLNRAAERGLHNLRIYMADAIDVLDDCIPEQSLDRVQIYFPDPWPKKRHHKRRLVQPAFVEKIRRKLVPGGLLHLATDWEDYAQHMLAVIDPLPGLENLAGPGEFSERPSFRPLTKFERRGRNLGHGIRDLLYRRRP
jgi:tRNA (guanine-N7-)-methyltransferase